MYRLDIIKKKKTVGTIPYLYVCYQEMYFGGRSLHQFICFPKNLSVRRELH